MNSFLMVFTSAHLLILGLLGFVILASLAVWFYRESSKSEGDDAVTKQNSGDFKKTHFIPVVNPGKVRTPPPLPPSVSRVVVPVETVRRQTTPVPVHVPTPAPALPPTQLPVSPATASDPATEEPQSLPPASPTFTVDAEVRSDGGGEPSLVLRCHGAFEGIPVGTIFFEVQFRYEEHDGAQLRICPGQGAAWRPLKIRRLLDRSVAAGECFELACLPLRELSGPVSGSQLVQANCMAYQCEPGFDPDESTPEHEPFCRVQAYVFVELDGLGYQEVARWLAVREMCLSVTATCSSDETDHRELHRAMMLGWVLRECQGLVAHPEFRRSCEARLRAVLDTTYLGVGTTASACHELMSALRGEPELASSLTGLFEGLGKVSGLSPYALERISNACLWLGISCPAEVESAIALAASQAQAVPDVQEPSPTPVKPPSPPVRPFAVTLSLLGAPESAIGVQVMVSGDLPVRTSSTDSLYFSVTVSDADVRNSWPFLVSAADVDALHDSLKPSATVARDQYDPSAPRKIAEVLFKDCAFPRNGERTLQVSCVGYSVDANGSLTRLCYADTEGTLKIQGTGYVTLRRRRRSLRGLTLQLALAAGTGDSVTLAQKTIAKDWIAAQASTVADPDERKLTVNSLTKILLGAAKMSQAEMVALALRLSGYRQPRYSQESVRLAEMLVGANPAAKTKPQTVLAKIRKELGLPAVSGQARAGAAGLSRRIVPASAPVAVVKKPQPPAAPKLNPRQVRARSLEKKLGRSMKGWKTFSTAKKVEHLKVQILAKSAKMPSCKGLAERHLLQQEIDDMSELVVMIRSGSGQS